MMRTTTKRAKARIKPKARAKAGARRQKPAARHPRATPAKPRASKDAAKVRATKARATKGAAAKGAAAKGAAAKGAAKPRTRSKVKVAKPGASTSGAPRRAAHDTAPPPATAARSEAARAEAQLTLAAYWAKLEECGWIAELTTLEQAELRDRLAKGLADGSQTAFYELAVTALDVECIEGSGPDEVCSYYSVLQQLARASAGLFAPQEIKDDLDKHAGKARLSFRCGGQLFSRELPYQSDFVEEGAIDLVNEALAATGQSRRFVPLPVDSQVVFFALISPPTYERARRAGLVPPDDYFFALD